MKVFLQYRPDETGKGKFTQRLIPELEKVGVKMSTRPKGCDITLSYTIFREESGNLPKVLRIDGMRLIRDKYDGPRNKAMRRDIDAADAVIWQSKFYKTMIGGINGSVGRLPYVIFNGADPRDYDDVAPVETPYRRNIIMSCKWDDQKNKPRRHKRFKESAKIARDYTAGDPDCCVWIIGNNDERPYENAQVRYVGWCDEEKLKHYLRMRCLYVYIPWFDWCPNAVVEAMASGCYVICSNNGGHAEMVQGYGRVVDIDRKIKPALITDLAVPEFSRDLVIAEIHHYFDDNPYHAMNPAVHIAETAKQYKQVFEDVLGGK